MNTLEKKFVSDLYKKYYSNEPKINFDWDKRERPSEIIVSVMGKAICLKCNKKRKVGKRGKNRGVCRKCRRNNEKEI